MVLAIQPKASHTVSLCSITELHPHSTWLFSNSPSDISHGLFQTLTWIALGSLSICVRDTFFSVCFYFFLHVLGPSFFPLLFLSNGAKERQSFWCLPETGRLSGGFEHSVLYR